MNQLFSIVFVSLFLILNCCIISSSGQKLNEIGLLKSALIHPVAEKQFSYAYKNNNEIQTIFSGMFLFYKKFISSQDMPEVCSFTPSCSEYGLLSVKKNGPVIGILNTFDRLTRCNGQNPDKYPKDEKTGRLLDMP